MEKLTKLTFLGDAICEKELLEQYHKNNRYDFKPIFEFLIPFLRTSDYVFCNLETPVNSQAINLTKELYSFCAPIEFPIALKEAGIDFVSTANNHCLDRGVEGAEETLRSLNAIGLENTGISINNTSHTKTIDLNGLKIGILSYTYGTNAFHNHNYLDRKSKKRIHVNLLQNQELSFPLDRWCYYHRTNIFARIYNKLTELLMKGQIYGPVYERREFNFFQKKEIHKEINKLKKNQVDLIITLLHIGGQYNKRPTKYASKTIEWLLKKGVNIISGNHEHVIHGENIINTQNNQLATFSLGNFCSTYGALNPPYDRLANYSIAWHIYIDKSKSIRKTSFSILKTIPWKEQEIKIVPTQTLYASLTDKPQQEALLQDIKEVYKLFMGKELNSSFMPDNLEFDII